MIDKLTRRGLLTGLGGLALAGGAATAMSEPGLRDPLLDAVSQWNDQVQAGVFSGTRMARTYAPTEITSPFRYNGIYPQAFTPVIDAGSWRLRVDGAVARAGTLSLAHLRSLPQESQITRLICIEGWSAVGEWAGVPLSAVLAAQGADLSRAFVRFECADGYHSSIDMASALHSQTILALDFLGRPLPTPFGAPCRLRIPTKLGFKNAKFVTRITVMDTYPGGYWEDQGYNWFAGL